MDSILCLGAGAEWRQPFTPRRDKRGGMLGGSGSGRPSQRTPSGNGLTLHPEGERGRAQDARSKRCNCRVDPNGERTGHEAVAM